MGKALHPSLRFAPAKVQIERRSDGAMILRSPLKLGGYARAVGAALDLDFGWRKAQARLELFPHDPPRGALRFGFAKARRTDILRETGDRPRFKKKPR